MIIRIADKLGTQLQGRSRGRKDFARMCQLLNNTPAGQVVLLDFAKVHLVTGSWVNSMLVSLLQWAAQEQNDLYFIICNANGDWLDELQLVAEWNHQCYLLVRSEAPPYCADLVGQLDSVQRKTLEAVLGLKEATGAQLRREKPEEKIEATAWNNRLKELHNMRLLRREKRGREQVYSPVVEEIKFDG